MSEHIPFYIKIIITTLFFFAPLFFILALRGGKSHPENRGYTARPSQMIPTIRSENYNRRNPRLSAEEEWMRQQVRTVIQEKRERH